MRYFWQFFFSFAISVLQIDVKADENDTRSGKSGVTQERAQQVAQAGASTIDKDPVKLADANFKWAIKPGQQPAEPPPPRPPMNTDREYDWWEQSPNKAAAKKSTSYYRRSDSYATNPDTDPPRYVRRLSDIGIEAFKDVTWLEIGFEHRTRYEMRH